MLENARRQLLLVLLAAAGAIVALGFLPLNRGLDLSGGVQLIYEVDPEQAKLDGTIPENATPDEISAILDETIEIIAERIDPQGVLEAPVTRRGDLGILIELPQMTAEETRAVEARIENLGLLEFRIVANDQYADPEDRSVRFDLGEEKRRLREWLDANDGANRKLVSENPRAIQVFNGLSAAAGGPQAGEWLRWFPKIVNPSLDDPKVWGRPMAIADTGVSDANEYNAVPVFGAEQWNGGLVPDGVPYLVELVPINMHEEYFRGEDLNPSAIRPGLDDYGRPSINYQMRTERADAYADWSEEYIQQSSAIILNGQVYSAPRFISKISGPAQITGDFTRRQVDELVKTLRTGSLKVKPIQQSSQVIGATLGNRSIQLAFMSIGIGALLTLGFVLAYYRIAGLVAFAALGLNILLILGVIVLIRATLTLPGLAGLVLTMGMAIDANILIYERIREELSKGKELLQACRTGFDRAIVTILDANLTTFIAGIVLYQFGVGPIRGFAVTLMIGIATTLFTAFFVSRLVFHYLLESGRLKEFRAATLFKDSAFDFLGLAKRAMVISVVLIVAGLATFVGTDRDKKYAIDFTGGANLTVVLREPMTQKDMTDLLAGDEGFRQLFPKPVVNTIGEVKEGRASTFGIRLKLTDELREDIDAARAADPTEYEPPYLTELRRVLAGRLVDDAYSGAQTFANNDNQNVKFAEIELHFLEEVEATALRAALRGLSAEVRVRPKADPEAGAAKDFVVEFDVPRDVNEDMLFPLLQDQLHELKDGDGETIMLSSPIPESSEIGGRMVGELRNSAVTALFVALFGIVMYIRVRFHEYKYGIAAVFAVVHDVLITVGAVVAFNAAGLVDCEIDLSMIAAFLTIIGYSINDTIVIFDRVRENLGEKIRLGEKIDRKALLNLSINQTLSRTILTTATTLAVVVTQFVVNYHAGTALEGFSFALLVGLIAGTYSTIFIASPVVLWFWKREGISPAEPDVASATGTPDPRAPARSGA
jgi:SecD/SecF fusion protein